MKKGVVIIIGIAAVAAFVVYWKNLRGLIRPQYVPPVEDVAVAVPTEAGREAGEEAPVPNQEVVAENLSIPWDIAFLPEGGLLVTERPGNLLLIENGAAKKIAIPETKHVGEGGLLGMTLHPDFASNRFLYLYLTANTPPGFVNRVVRYTFQHGELSDERTIIGNIPGAIYHDGGRLRFGPDGFLYVTTGDATTPESSQDAASLAGKILRVRDDGEAEVYSYGHRNPQGLAWDDQGRLWATEHGRSGVASGLDELNLIQRGGNYGWPDSQGDSVASGTIGPVIHSGSRTTWAPASALYWDGSIFFGGLRGETLYEAVLDGERVKELKEHFAGEFGRLRTVALGPDGMFYLTTSNRDGRGSVNAGDDKIIRINPKQFR